MKNLFLFFSFTEFNECASNPCLNGGRCIDGLGRFICECLGDFVGERCGQSKFYFIISSSSRHGMVHLDIHQMVEVSQYYITSISRILTILILILAYLDNKLIFILIL